MMERSRDLENLRILLTADSVGGVWNHAVELAAGLRARGAEIMILVLGRKLAPSQIRSVPTGVQWKDSDFRLEWMEDPWKDVELSQEWIDEVCSDWKPDILHFNSFAFATKSRGLPVVLGIHSCVASWWKAVRGDSLDRNWKRYLETAGEAVASADLVVTPSSAMMRAVLENYPGKMELRVIPNGVDLAPAFPGRSLRKSRILAAGRIWDDAKNLQILNKVAPFLPWPVEIAGPSHAPGNNHKGVSLDNLHCLGHLSQDALHTEMRESSIFAAPSLYEPFGLAVLEAARLGCALVLSDIPSFRENWEGAALFADPHSPADWRKAIGRLMLEENLRKRLAQQAAALSCRFNRSSMAGAYASEYRRLVTKKISALAA